MLRWFKRGTSRKLYRDLESSCRYACIITACLIACTSRPKDGTNGGDEAYAAQQEIRTSSTQTNGLKVHVVEIRQMKFQPREIKVHKGETVVWVNKDITDHDVTELKTREWTSSTLPAGASWTLVVTESADYYCNLHQVMRGKIIVE
jgi:plastocyanin